MKSVYALLLLTLINITLFAQEKTAIKTIEVTASELIARAGAAKEYRSLGSFKRNDILPVYSIAGDWYETKCPPELKVYIFQKYITVTGNSGVITGNNVNGRADASEDSQILFKFPIKTQVDVLGLTNGWVLIAPPPQATAWVAKQYTRDVSTNENIIIVDNTTRNTPRNTTTTQQVVENDESTSETKPVDIEKPKTTKNTPTKNTNEVSPEVQDILDERNKKKEQIIKNQEEIQQEILNSKEEETYLKTGWIRRLGRVIGRKATHALYISEGTDICHLISNDDSIKLEDYAGKYVGIKGEENGKEKRSDVPLITVTQIVILDANTKKIRLENQPASTNTPTNE